MGLLTPEMEHVRRLHHRLFGHRGGCQADAVLFLGGVDQDAAHLAAPDVEHQFLIWFDNARASVRVLAMMFTWRIGRSVMPSVEPPTLKHQAHGRSVEMSSGSSLNALPGPRTCSARSQMTFSESGNWPTVTPGPSP